MWQLLQGIILIGVTAGLVLLVGKLIRARSDYSGSLEEISAINSETAEALIDEIRNELEKGGDWSRLPKESIDSRLPHSAREFFECFGEIRNENWEFRLSPDCANSASHGYLCIGTVSDGKVFVEVSTGELLDCENGESPEQGLRFKSIFHFVAHSIRSWNS